MVNKGCSEYISYRDWFIPILGGVLMLFIGLQAKNMTFSEISVCWLLYAVLCFTHATANVMIDAANIEDATSRMNSDWRPMSAKEYEWIRYELRGGRIRWDDYPM